MNITGEYETNNGKMAIEKDGNVYKGTYAESGVICGLLAQGKSALESAFSKIKCDFWLLKSQSEVCSKNSLR